MIMASAQHTICKKMNHHRGYHGALNVTTISNKGVPYITQFRDYMANQFSNDQLLLKGVFSFIVDTGCSYSYSPFKEDFETLTPLEKPITLKGVVVDILCTHAIHQHKG